jgi:hypothetical protein
MMTFSSFGLWPALPIALLVVLGLGLVVEAIDAQIKAAGVPWSTSARLLTWLRGFRLAIIGLALVGIALAWLWGETWLLVLSICIAGEETFETTWMISTLKRDRRKN